MFTLWWSRSGNGAWRGCSAARIAIPRVMRICRRSCGHFWQSRFYSCALDAQHAWEALAYVERNPVRAGLAEKAEDYQWSTAAAHCREDGLAGLLDLEQWGRQFTGEYWREALGIGLRDAAMEERIREATRRGFPLGGDEFVDRISRALGRDVRPRPPGRPTKPADAAFSVMG